MIKSMTGFAELTHEDDEVSIGVSAKSVNHRYLDVQLRLPPVLAELESTLRRDVSEVLARGRVELSVSLRIKRPPTVSVDLNTSLVEALVDAASTVQEKGWVDQGLGAGDLLRFPQVMALREEPVDRTRWQQICQCVMETTRQALSELDRMRQREGTFLERDLGERADAVKSLVDQIVTEAEAGAESLRARLEAKIGELGATIQTEPAAVAAEVVRFVARSDIHEELARLRGHLDHLAQLTEASAPCGRQLDFLVQEMNREVNTIGSKAEGRAIGSLVVTAKAELEKLREQLQNVE